MESDFLDDLLELREHTNRQHIEVGYERGVEAIGCHDSYRCGQASVVHGLKVGRYRQVGDAHHNIYQQKLIRASYSFGVNAQMSIIVMDVHEEPILSLPSVSSAIHNEGTLIEVGFKLEISADGKQNSGE